MFMHGYTILLIVDKNGYLPGIQHNYEKPPCLRGKLTISMAMFNSYFDISRGQWKFAVNGGCSLATFHDRRRSKYLDHGGSATMPTSKVWFILGYLPVKIPSGNQTWQWKRDHRNR